MSRSMDALTLVEPCSGIVPVTLELQDGERIETTCFHTGFYRQRGEVKLNSWIEIPPCVEGREKEIKFLISGCEFILEQYDLYQVLGGELDERQSFGVLRLILEAAN